MVMEILEQLVDERVDRSYWRRGIVQKAGGWC